MKPIPVVFHLGPLQVHTYGIGLAITFWFAYRYFDRRLRAHGYPHAWVGSVTFWTLVSALVGARVVHVVANMSFYLAQPIQIPLVWHGGLSSFGGLLFGVPTGVLLARRRCPEVKLSVLADLIAPVLLASWAIGRLLGPQLMIAGGGHPTHQWFGMYYAGQVGKRLPVPIFQSAMAFAVLLIAWQVERYVQRRGGPVGLVMAVTVGGWGVNRFIEEHFWLAYPGHVGALAVEGAGIAFAVVGFATAAVLLTRFKPGQPALAGPGDAGSGDSAEVPGAGTQSGAAGEAEPAVDSGVDRPAGQPVEQASGPGAAPAGGGAGPSRGPTTSPA